VAVVEGGASAWTQDNITKFAAGGGQRVIFAAGQKGNEWEMKAGAKRFETSGAQAHAVFAEVGHTLDEPLQNALIKEMGWFLEGDARWAKRPGGGAAPAAP
jgi:hypothetical protein